MKISPYSKYILWRKNEGYSIVSVFKEGEKFYWQDERGKIVIPEDSDEIAEIPENFVKANLLK